MSVLAGLDWWGVKEHYEARVRVHRKLLALRKARKMIEFSELALGIVDPAGNYSASEHGLGPAILHQNPNAIRRVWRLGGALAKLKNVHDVPPVVRDAALSFLGIGVGSEMSCLLNPKVCWVCNVRTIWANLVIKHNDDLARANMELALYRDDDISSDMNYRKWAALHGDLATGMTRLAAAGAAESAKKKVPAGKTAYLWADAIANALYNAHADGGYLGCRRG